MVGHVAENVVVDIAEEMHLGLDAPVKLGVGQGRVFVEEAAVPAAHLVVGFHATVLDVIFLENLGRFLEYLFIDPGGDFPVFFWNQFYNRLAISPKTAEKGAIPYLHSALVSACVLFLKSSVNGTSLKNVHG